MASVSFHIANLLDKMTSTDKDFRFMATNDLMSELQKDSIKLDDDSERKVVKMLLRLLEDKNGEVQNLAVKCLGPLVTKVKEFQVETIVESLCSNMMSEKEQLRDISSIGLKTVIAELPAAQPAPNMPPIVSSVCKKITGKLTAAIANKDDVSVQLEALDILADLLSRFGSMLLPFHSGIQEALLPQLASPRLAVRKRAIIAIGYLVLSCPNGLYNNLLDYLLTELTKNSSLSTTRTYIQCIGAVSRQSGPRFGEHLERVMPLVMGYCKNRSEEVDDELREHCLQAFESFVRRCPKEIAPSIPMIMKLCCEFISHDPNYNYEDDGVDGMELEDDENDSDDEYSDDDDMSWKGPLWVTEENSLTVRWLPPPSKSVTEYNVEVREAGKKSSKWHTAGNTTTTELSIPELHPDTPYHVRLAAIDEEKQVISWLEGDVKFYGIKAPPPKPKYLNVDRVSVRSVELSWSMPSDVDDLTGFVIFKKKIGGEEILERVDTVSRYVSSYIVHNLKEKGMYQFMIRAENMSGLSEPLTTQVVALKTNVTRPSPPAGPLKIKKSSSDSLLIKWDTPAYDGGVPIEGYDIAMKDTMKTMWMQVAHVSANFQRLSIQELKEGRDYAVRVYARNEAGRSKPLESAMAVTVKPPRGALSLPGPPKGPLRFEEIRESSIHLKWEPPDYDGGGPILFYIIEGHAQYKDCEMLLEIINGNLTECILTEAHRGKVYRFKIYAENKAGMGEPLICPCRVRIVSGIRLPAAPGPMKVEPYVPGLRNALHISWKRCRYDGGSPLAGYVLEKRVAPSTEWVSAIPAHLHDLEVTLTAVQVGHTYEFRVLAENVLGLSPPSTSSTAVTVWASAEVRRASAKCLEAIIATRPEMLPTFYKEISPVLIDRFKEREENVQADILHCYVTLLKMTRPSIGPSKSDPDSMDHTEAPVLMLQQQVPQIVRAVARHMKDKSMKRRQGCFQLLTELVMVLPEALADHINLIIPALHFSLSEKCQSSNMKMETLSLIHVLLMTHSPSVFHPHIPTLLPPIISSVDDSFYKITSEALLVTQQLVKVIRPLDMPSNFDFTPYTDSLYTCTLIRLKAADIDQEVKERAIACMGTIISHLGDHLQAQLETCLPIFLERLKNEITRLTAVKALTGISASPLRVDLRLILGDAFPILASFLRKNQRALKLCTLSLLNKLVQNYNSVTVAMLNKVLIEVPPLLTESELHIAQLTLILLTSIAQLHPQALYNINDAILPEIFKLLESPLLQGAALNSLLKLFQALVYAEIPGVGYVDLLEVLMSPVHKHVARGDVVQLHKQTYHSVAKCVAALTVTQKSTGATGNVVGQLVNDIQRGSSRGGEALWMFSLLALGEIGRHIDLSNVNGLQECILNSFSAPSEEVKSAAAFALGGVSTGNLSYFLPTLLKEIQCQPRRLYLLLHSLKEIISHLSRHGEGEAALSPWIAPVWKELFNHCECPEEGTRNVVAECLGKLTLLDPSTLLPRLKAQLQHPSGLMRATVVTAIKFTISDQPSAIDSLLRGCIGEFLQALVDPELNVRRVALVAFNSAAHNKPSLIRDLLVTVLPHLYNETKVRKDLIREVEMGPFKHTVDDGLDVRKAAWECMYTLLDACRERLDVFEFLSHVEDGLRDHYDIQMLTYLMLVRLAQLCPNAVLHHKNPAIADFLNQVKASSELQAMYDSVQKDNASNPGPVGTPPDAIAMDIS